MSSFYTLILSHKFEFLHTVAETQWSSTSSIKKQDRLGGCRKGMSFKTMFEEAMKNTGFHSLLPLESGCLVALVGLLEATVHIQ